MWTFTLLVLGHQNKSTLQHFGLLDRFSDNMSKVGEQVTFQIPRKDLFFQINFHRETSAVSKETTLRDWKASLMVKFSPSFFSWTQTAFSAVAKPALACIGWSVIERSGAIWSRASQSSLRRGWMSWSSSGLTAAGLG